MAAADSTGVIDHARTTRPSRRLTAAGIITRRHGRTVQITRTATGTTGAILPKRVRGASEPPKPTVPPPVAFLTASKAPADLDGMAGWTAADFETMRILDETTQPLPAEILDAALMNVEAAFALWEAEEHVRVEAELDRAWAEL